VGLSPEEVIRFTATYSIVARDAASGDLGVAVQSHYFSVGSSVSWAEAGVGAVATQAFGNPAYGRLGLERLRHGESPDDALRALLAADEGRELRQVAMVDARGRVAVHTGRVCVVEAGHEAGDGFSVQGNMLRSNEVWGAMARAYREAEGDLAERMLAALIAGEAGGGDVRGRQSAAMRVVSGESGEQPKDERSVDLRVDDHEDPLGELSRLLNVHRATQLMEQAMETFQAGDSEGALAALARARELRTGDPQIHFWEGITLARAGRIDEACASLAVAYAADPGWKELVRRLVPLGMVPNDPALVDRLTRDARD